jgi:hypothetical protein
MGHFPNIQASSSTNILRHENRVKTTIALMLCQYLVLSGTLRDGLRGGVMK